MFLTKLLISFHGVQFVNPYANCELPLSKTTKTDRKVKISIFYPLKHPLYVKVMLNFYLPYLPLSNLLYLCNVIIKILNVMSSENYSNCVSELDLDMCKDYFITKLVYDDGSIKYRIVHLKNGLNQLGKEMLFDDIHSVLDYISYN